MIAGVLGLSAIVNGAAAVVEGGGVPDWLNVACSTYAVFLIRFLPALQRSEHRLFERSVTLNRDQLNLEETTRP